MLNLLSGELYKLRKSKCFVISCVAVIVSVIMVYGMLYLANEIQQGNVENGMVGVVVSEDVGKNATEESVFESMQMIEILQVAIGNFVSVISVIFSAVFTIGEFGNGAIKNLAGKGYSRGKILVSKYISIILATVAFCILGTIVNTVLGCVFIGADTMSTQMVRDYIIYTLLMTGLVVATNSLVVTIAEISRNMAIGISVGVCMVGGISSIIFNGIDLLLHSFSLKPSKYWLLNLMQECPFTDFGSEIVTRIVVSTLVWAVVAIAAGMIHFHKADIK